MTARIRAIVFDLDSTLWYFPVAVPSDFVHARCAEQIGPLLAKWGVPVDARALSQSVLAAVEQARRAAVAGSMISPDFRDVVDRVARSAGITLDPDDLDALWSSCQVDGARLGRQLYPDTVTTLAWAQRAGYRLGLISNRWSGHAETQRELDGFGIGGFFDGVFLSSEMGWLKPHPEIFYAASRGLGVESGEMVVVGDSLRMDIAPARMLGMRAVWKRNGRRDPPQRDQTIPPDAVIDDLWELRRLPFFLVDRAAAIDVPAPGPR